MPEPFEPSDSTFYPESYLICEVGLSPAALAKARRTGKLRYTRVGNRVLILGSWLREWLEADARKPRGRRAVAC